MPRKNRRHETQVTLGKEELQYLLQHLEAIGDNSIVSEDGNDDYEVWKRCYNRLRRALDRCWI